MEQSEKESRVYEYEETKEQKDQIKPPLLQHGSALATGGLIQPKALRALLRSTSRGSSSQFKVDGDDWEQGAGTKGVDEECKGW